MKKSPETHIKLTSGDRLLLLCLEPKFDVCKVKKLLSQDIDWNDFIKKAWTHRITPILFYNFKTHNILSQLPKNVSKILNKSYSDTLKHNMLYYAELIRILKALKEEGIDVIILKGAAFAEILYENIGLRHFKDIDLLVKKENLKKVQKIFNDLKYSVPEGFRPKKYFLRHHFHFHYEKKTQTENFIFEVHWHLVEFKHPVYINIFDLWEHAIPFTINNLAVKSLSWNHNLLYLSWHNAINCFSELIGIYDMSKILIQFSDKISYDILMEETIKSNLKIPVYFSFLLIEKLFGIPEAIDLKKIVPSKKVIRFFIKLYTKERILQKYVNIDWSIRSVVTLCLFEGIEYKIQYLKDLLFPKEKDLDKFYYENPELITFWIKVKFFIKGAKAIFHMLWFLIYPSSLLYLIKKRNKQ